MPRAATEFDSCVARLRAARLQSWVQPTDRIIEFGAKDELTVSALIAAEKVLLSRDDLRASLQQRQSADVILCCEVLEYLPDPAETLELLKDLVKPGGLLIVIALYDDGFRYPNLETAAAHLYSWNVQTLGNLLLDCGYAFVEGRMERAPNEDAAIRLATRWGLGSGGFKAALRASQLIAPRRLVRVVGRRPS